MKRILHLTAGNLFGGIETLMLTLAIERDRCPEIVPEFGVCFEGRLSSELRQSGVNVHMLGNVRFRRPWTVWLARRRLRKLLAMNRPSAVITHACWTHCVFASVVKAAGIPLFFWAHDAANPNHWLDRKAARVRPRGVIANSQFTASGISELYPSTPVDVIIYPLVQPQAGDKSRREMLRREFKTDPDSIVILMACRMEAWKGHRALLSALSQLTDNLNWTCWIAGGSQRPQETKYLAELHQLELQLGLANRVRWLGQRQDVADVMAASNIFCQPNQTPEPFGIVLVEALYASLPVVTVRKGGAAEIVDDSCGMTIETNNPEYLAEALRTLIENGELRLKLGSNGPDRANSLCDVDRQLQKLYSHVIAYSNDPYNSADVGNC
ncbi:MAG: glycosyltransferase family 4 protein [Planctomycetes bacterium]|nr:glycosyltransferase family 4 protein [Planctomycetota bacterium]